MNAEFFKFIKAQIEFCQFACVLESSYGGKQICCSQYFDKIGVMAKV